MSIYNDIKAYANENNISEEQAKIRCEYFLAVEKQVELAMVCPTCKQATLEVEPGSYEEGYPTYIRCDNDKVPFIEEGQTESIFTDCEFTSDVTDEFAVLSDGRDFDIVRYIAGDIRESDSEYPNFPDNMSWSEFVDDDNLSLLKAATEPL